MHVSVNHTKHAPPAPPSGSPVRGGRRARARTYARELQGALHATTWDPRWATSKRSHGFFAIVGTSPIARSQSDLRGRGVCLFVLLSACMWASSPCDQGIGTLTPDAHVEPSILGRDFALSRGGGGNKAEQNQHGVCERRFRSEALHTNFYGRPYGFWTLSLSLLYGCSYMFHLSSNARRDSYFTGS